MSLAAHAIAEKAIAGHGAAATSTGKPGKRTITAQSDPVLQPEAR